MFKVPFEKGRLRGFKDLRRIMEDFDDFLLRYPQKEDSLLKQIAGDHHYVILDPYCSLGPLADNWAKYISGYKDAADILVDKIINDRSIQDHLSLPIIYLYRHCIELSLKLIIRYGYELYDIKENYEEIHTLDKLWKVCREIIEKAWPKEQKYVEILNATGIIINDLSKIDPSGQETRYPERKTIKNKKKSQKNNIIEVARDRRLTMEGISKINLKNMKEVIEKLYIFLGDMADAISIELSEKRDIESEYNFD
jgi:hypothetical protein